MESSIPVPIINVSENSYLNWAQFLKNSTLLNDKPR